MEKLFCRAVIWLNNFESVIKVLVHSVVRVFPFCRCRHHRHRRRCRRRCCHCCYYCLVYERMHWRRTKNSGCLQLTHLEKGGKFHDVHVTVFELYTFIIPFANLMHAYTHAQFSFLCPMLVQCDLVSDLVLLLFRYDMPF